MRDNWHLECTAKDGVNPKSLFKGRIVVSFSLYAVDKEDATKKAAELLKMLKTGHHNPEGESFKGWDKYNHSLINTEDPSFKADVE